MAFAVTVVTVMIAVVTVVFLTSKGWIRFTGQAMCWVSTTACIRSRGNRVVTVVVTVSMMSVSVMTVVVAISMMAVSVVAISVVTVSVVVIRFGA